MSPRRSFKAIYQKVSSRPRTVSFFSLQMLRQDLGCHPLTRLGRPYAWGHTTAVIMIHLQRTSKAKRHQWWTWMKDKTTQVPFQLLILGGFSWIFCIYAEVRPANFCIFLETSPFDHPTTFIQNFGNSSSSSSPSSNIPSSSNIDHRSVNPQSSKYQYQYQYHHTSAYIIHPSDFSFPNFFFKWKSNPANRKLPSNDSPSLHQSFPPRPPTRSLESAAPNDFHPPTPDKRNRVGVGTQ